MRKIQIGPLQGLQDKEKVKTLRKAFEYIEEDEGNEVNVELGDEDVEIIFIYVQQVFNSDFGGPLVNEQNKKQNPPRGARPKPKLADKVKTMYAAMSMK